MSMKYVPVINVEMPTIIKILNFLTKTNSELEIVQLLKSSSVAL